MLSRNFSLQEVGDWDWILSNYEFKSIAFSVDELVLLNVSRNKNIEQFLETVETISKYCFLPLSAGGWIDGVESVRSMLNAGADKVVINTLMFENPSLVKNIIQIFGSQSIVGSIDYRTDEKNGTKVLSNRGSKDVGMTLEQAISYAQNLGFGELYLTSVDRDGTGQGLDVDRISFLAKDCGIPVIISGGAGNYAHLSHALETQSISAVSTANIFNFMADNLTEARDHIRSNGVQMALFESTFS